MTSTTVPKLDLPTFPALATKLIELLSHDDASVADAVALIECEPAVATQVLQLANSPLYAATRSITTINHAIVLLGFKSVSQLALSVATGRLFEAPPGAAAENVASRKLTFRQSLGVATVARSITCWTERKVNPDEAFLTGILHDVGKLAFLTDQSTADYCSLLHIDPNGDTTQLEQKRYGISHPTLGHQCGMKWGIPSSINVAIREHHEPVDAVASNLSKTVIAAVWLAKHWQLGFVDKDPEPIPNSILQFLGRSPTDEEIEECAEQHRALLDTCT